VTWPRHIIVTLFLAMMTLIILASISSKLFVQYRLHIVYGQNGCDLATGIGCLACPNVFSSSGYSYPCYLLPTTTCAADSSATHRRDTTCYIGMKMGNFVSLQPKVTSILLCLGLALAFGLVLSYVTPHETLALWRRFYLHILSSTAFNR